MILAPLPSTPVSGPARPAGRASAAPRTPTSCVQLHFEAQDPAALLRALRHACEAVQADARGNWPQLPGTQGDGWSIS